MTPLSPFASVASLMFPSPISINTKWNEEAKVWCPSSDDVLNLESEAAQFDALPDLVRSVLADRLEFDPERGTSAERPIVIHAVQPGWRSARLT